jgi:hypothetical protein
MAGFNPQEYDQVHDRLPKFWADHENGRVLTDLVFHDDRRFIVKAEIYFDREDMTPVASGLAEEIVGVGMVNKTSALENCETSAIGRALANCGYAGSKRPSLEEMTKVERYAATPRKPVTPSIKPTDAQIKKITKLYDDIAVTSDVDTLRQWFKTEASLLDLPVGGTTVRDALTKKAESVK